MDDRIHIGAGEATMTAGTDDDGRSPEDRAFLKTNGEALVIRLFAASKTLRLYDVKNRATQRVLIEVMESLGRIMEREGRIFIRSSNEFLLLNEYRIPVEPQHYGPFEFWVGEMKKREVEAIEIGSMKAGSAATPPARSPRPSMIEASSSMRPSALRQAPVPAL